MTQITREEIERLLCHFWPQSEADETAEPLSMGDCLLLAKAAREWVDAPARLDAARREGEAAGINASLLHEVMDQAANDLALAHAEIIKLQGADPANFTWPEWSSPANTLRWFDKLRALHPLTPAPAESSDEVTWEEASEIAVRIAMGRQTEKAPAEPSAPVAPPTQALCDEAIARVLDAHLAWAARPETKPSKALAVATAREHLRQIENARIATLEAEVAALREGLRFYGDGDSYLGGTYSNAQADCGRRARALLRGQGGGK